MEGTILRRLGQERPGTGHPLGRPLPCLLQRRGGDGISARQPTLDRDGTSPEDRPLAEQWHLHQRAVFPRDSGPGRPLPPAEKGRNSAHAVKLAPLVKIRTISPPLRNRSR